MSKFSFVTDQDISNCIEKVIIIARKSSLNAESFLDQNTLDPFSALFESLAQGIDLEHWKQHEKNRQTQKSIQNAIGEFHQSLLGCFKNWNNPGKGGSFDLENTNSKIIAEIKNKHNTMNSSSSMATYKKLSDHLKYDKKDYTAYLVQIVPSKSADYNQPWSPNLATEKLREDIRKIDGESFYDLASGEKDTLQRIYEYLPEVICKILKTKEPSKETINQFQELFKSIYK